MRWERLHPQQGTQLRAQGWLLSPTATSGALGTGLGLSHTLLSLCLAVAVPRALLWGREGSFGPSAAAPTPAHGHSQVSPGWPRSQEHPRQPQLSPGTLGLWGTSLGRICRSGGRTGVPLPRAAARGWRPLTAAEPARGCVLRLSELREPCWHCHGPLCRVAERALLAGSVHLLVPREPSPSATLAPLSPTPTWGGTPTHKDQE